MLGPPDLIKLSIYCKTKFLNQSLYTISQLHIHVPTEVFPFISPPLCYLAHSANSTSMWKPGNAENNHCWNHLVHWKYSHLSVVHLHSKSQKENTELSNMQFRVPSSLASCDHGRCTGDSQLDHLQHTKAKPETQWASHLGRKTSISWFSKEIQTLTTVFPQIINEEIHLREKGTEGGSQHIRCGNFHLKMVFKNVYDFVYKPVTRTWGRREWLHLRIC